MLKSNRETISVLNIIILSKKYLYQLTKARPKIALMKCITYFPVIFAPRRVDKGSKSGLYNCR